MDTDELLKRYAAGERNFHEANLIGASLSEAFLTGLKQISSPNRASD